MAKMDPKPGDSASDEAGKKPVQVFSYWVAKDTYVQASVWERLVQTDGFSFTTHDISVRKRMKVGNDYKSFYSFRTSELPALMRALARAEDWVLETKKQDVPF